MNKLMIFQLYESLDASPNYAVASKKLANCYKLTRRQDMNSLHSLQSGLQHHGAGTLGREI